MAHGATAGVHRPMRVWRVNLGSEAQLPLLAALSYPFLLDAFHALVANPAGGTVRQVMAAATLTLAFLVPVAGVATLVRLGRIQRPTRFELRARHLALLVVAAPPLFVLSGVGLGLLGTPVRDTTAWCAFWTAALVYSVVADDRQTSPSGKHVARWRVAHGAVAAVLLLYVLFHLGNHLVGLLGPAAHARVMAAGRIVYRSRLIEPLLIALLGLQIMLGVRLAWRWCAICMDWHRSLQVASGAYVGAFVLTHLNSALISARAVRGIPTDWAWASGAPEGLVADVWNIRLLPHYGFAVFFVLLHLCAGLRVILLAHGTSTRVADRVWMLGAAASLGVAAAIVAALCGVRF